MIKTIKKHGERRKRVDFMGNPLGKPVNKRLKTPAAQAINLNALNNLLRTNWRVRKQGSLPQGAFAESIQRNYTKAIFAFNFRTRQIRERFGVKDVDGGDATRRFRICQYVNEGACIGIPGMLRAYPPGITIFKLKTAKMEIERQRLCH
jgi:hypothetical protein